MKKAIVTSLFAISLLALTGIAWAAYTSPVYINGTATAGSVSISYVTNSQTVDGTGAASANCAAQIVDSTHLTLGMGTIAGMPAAPGDVCGFGVKITNTGTLPALVTESFTGSIAPFTYTDNIATHTGSLYILPGGTFVYSSTMTLPAAATTGQGSTVTFSITITGTGTA